MIRVTNITRTIDVDQGGVSSGAKCRALIVNYNSSTKKRDFNKAEFHLTDEESALLNDLSQMVESRLGTSLTAEVEPVEVQHATDLETYCPACREYRCKLLRAPEDEGEIIDAEFGPTPDTPVAAE